MTSPSRWSRPERRRRAEREDDSGPRTGRSRAQTEPVAALAALFAVGVGLTLYVGAAVVEQPAPEGSSAEPVLEELSSTAVTDGVVAPDDVPSPSSLARGGERVRITLAFDGEERTYGPPAPPDADRAERPVSVAVRPGERRPGRLVVEVWT